jgi:hypothetical protein
MASASTYVPIANQVLTSATASVTFSSISSAYTDLVLVCNHRGVTGSSGNGLYVTLNGDTGANYSDTALYGNGSSAGSGRDSNITAYYVGAGSVATEYSSTNINFMNYANTTTYKTMLARTGDARLEARASAGLWRNTSAINSILVSYYGYNFDAGSTFTLYGILAA